jgi:hypothetical protein
MLLLKVAVVKSLPSFLLLNESNMNKYIITGVFACVVCMFWGIVGVFACVLPVFAFVCFVSWILARVQHVLLLREYANMTENIYVQALFEFDPSIRSRAAHHRKLLIESGNNTGIVVHELYFGYGEHCNENFEQYQQRVEAFVADDRVKRHKALCKFQDFYLKHTLKQQF